MRRASADAAATRHSTPGGNANGSLPWPPSVPTSVWSQTGRPAPRRTRARAPQRGAHLKVSPRNPAARQAHKPRRLRFSTRSPAPKNEAYTGGRGCREALDFHPSASRRQSRRTAAPGLWATSDRLGFVCYESQERFGVDVQRELARSRQARAAVILQAVRAATTRASPVRLAPGGSGSVALRLT